MTMLQFTNTFFGMLIIQLILSYALSYRTMTSAFEINSYHSCRPTSTALHEIQMSKPFPASDVNIDHERAQYCVNHFGTCTIAEMESLKNGFHTERMQSLIFGVENDNNILESRVLEGELDHQMALLKELNSITDVSLLPTDTIEDEILPNLHDFDSHENAFGIFHRPTPSDIFVLEETILEENLLEPIAICFAIIGLALLPQFL